MCLLPLLPAGFAALQATLWNETSVTTPKNWGGFLQAANNYFMDLLVWCPLWFMGWLLMAISPFPRVPPEECRARRVLGLPSLQCCICFTISLSEPTFMESFCGSCSGLFCNLWASPTTINSCTCLLGLSRLDVLLWRMDAIYSVCWVFSEHCFLSWPEKCV